MKKLLLATAAFALASTGTAALAQDNASSFGGFYLGAQVSGARLTDKHSDYQEWYDGVRNSKKSKTKVQVGVRGGYDFVSGHLIAGVLGEVNFGKINTFHEHNPSDPEYAIGTRIKMLGSARAKAGFTSGRFALTANGGFAFNDSKQRYRETDGTGQFYNGHGKRTGWVLGAEAAYALTQHVSLGLDYSHYQFGRGRHVILDSSGVPEDGSSASDGLYHWSQKDAVDSVGLNVSYRF
jgi:outer membrane immunogenic protein